MSKMIDRVTYRMTGEHTFRYYTTWPFNILCVPHTVVIATSACVNDAVINAHCKIYRRFCPNLQLTEDPGDAKRCCGMYKINESILPIHAHEQVPKKSYLHPCTRVSLNETYKALFFYVLGLE